MTTRETSTSHSDPGVLPAAIPSTRAEPAAPPDGEAAALRRLAVLQAHFPNPKRPDAALQAVCDLARELTRGTYSALAITDDRDRTEGFFTSGLAAELLRGLKVPPTGH